MDKNTEIETSRAKLLESFSGSPDLVFLRGWGNLGDELIWAGTRQLLSGLRYREVNIGDIGKIRGHTALFTGGGGWCLPFQIIPPYLPQVEERFESVIVLPTTFDISQPITQEILKKTKAKIFAREMVSYRQIQSYCDADIAHDCAFYFDFEKYKCQGQGVLNAFRVDRESSRPVLPADNIDISKTCSSLDEWLWTISKYELVRTDRAHVMIAAALLGKRVEYLSSIYHKLPAIAEYSLKNYPVVRIPETEMPKQLVEKDAGDFSFRRTVKKMLIKLASKV